MRFFYIVLGIYSLFGAAYCIAWPDETFLNVGWVLSILLILLGVCGISAHLIAKNRIGEGDSSLYRRSIVSLVLGLVSTALTIASYSNETINAYITLAIVVLMAAWLLFDAIVYYIKFYKLNKKSDSKWIFCLIIAIIDTLALVVILCTCTLSLIMVNITIGIVVAMIGIRLLCAVGLKDKTAVL